MLVTSAVYITLWAGAGWEAFDWGPVLSAELAKEVRSVLIVAVLVVLVVYGYP